MLKIKPNQFYLPSGALITERPILYQTEMIQANLEDRKTQTRREIKNYPKGDQALDLGELYKHNPEYFFEISPFGRPGDLLWAKETAQFGNGKHYYKSDFTESLAAEASALGAKWTPSIHMPKAASRIWSMVEDIRVERVQEISEADAIAEGIDSAYSDIFKEWRYRDYFDGKRRSKAFAKFPDMAKQTGFGSMPWPDWRDPISSFNSLWLSINGKESWDSNPWVWVIQYRILSKTCRPSLEVISESYEDVVNHKSEIENQDA